MAWRSVRILAALAFATATWATIARVSHRAVAARRATSPPAVPPLPEASDEGEADAGPLMSPVRFTITHFGLLAALFVVIFGGLAYRGIARYPQGTTFYVPGGDAARGRSLMTAYGCGGCHVIPGVRGAEGRVGPSLAGFADQMYVGGQLPNTPEHLIAWLRDPQRYAPGTAMPNLNVSEADARDMAAFLYDRR